MKSNLLLHDDLPPSKYRHWEYSKFKDFKPYINNYKLGFFKFIGNTRYVCETNDFLLLKLIEYYKDLNKILERVLNNYRDEMFLRYAFRIHFFVNEERFNVFLAIWDDLFSYSLERYLKEYHKKFDPSYGISYVSYFNMRFSAMLLFETIKTLVKYNKHPNIYAKDIEKISLSNLSCLLQGSPLEYPSSQYFEVLSYQSSSPSHLTTD